jgi:hypothetical protein
VPPKPACLESIEFSETNQVPVRSLYGLWVILAAAIVIAMLAACVRFYIIKRTKPEQRQLLNDRVKPFRESLRRVVSMTSVTEAFRTAGASARRNVSVEQSTTGVLFTTAHASSRGRLPHN